MALVAAGALAGYAAINVSALLTACELGIQPLFFKDAGTQEIGAVIKVHVQDDGTELIEVDDPRSHPGRTLLDLPRLNA